jgi:hypothetical protein
MSETVVRCSMVSFLWQSRNVTYIGGGQAGVKSWFKSDRFHTPRLKWRLRLPINKSNNPDDVPSFPSVRIGTPIALFCGVISTIKLLKIPLKMAQPSWRDALKEPEGFKPAAYPGTLHHYVSYDRFISLFQRK